mmetsp:Transcript_91075/g.253590  ORF Transcript_91075/g.253590 Transcript_91075/m.253590 type:complete len:200 (+) Transcript_91075:580-1179(+)
MAWAAATKCVVGAASMTQRTRAGMLSRGVTPPDSICSGSSTSTSSMPNCGIERASVARKMPSEVVANRCSAAASANSATEPCTGTPSAPCTMKLSEAMAATSTTRPMDQTLASMISPGVTGITSRCSTVPCSRSRISAAPVRMMESMVTLLMISISEPNQGCSRLGLKRMRTARSTGGVAPPLCRSTKRLTSAAMICCT